MSRNTALRNKTQKTASVGEDYQKLPPTPTWRERFCRWWTSIKLPFTTNPNLEGEILRVVDFDKAPFHHQPSMATFYNSPFALFYTISTPKV
jgi:hypothetical protein